MSYITVTFNGNTFSIPASGEVGPWAVALNQFLQALASGAPGLNVANELTQQLQLDKPLLLTSVAAPAQSGSGSQVYTDVADGYAYVIPASPASATPIKIGSTGVTSVGMTVPAIMAVSGSPVTGSGTLAVSLNTQAANTVLAGPTSGGSATPAFRALTVADLPAPFAAKTANYPILVADTQTRFSNLGALASVTFTLPTATSGLEFYFTCMAAQNLVVTGAASSIVGPSGLTGTHVTVYGTLPANRYTSFKLGCYDGSTWVVQNLTGAIAVS